MLVTVRSASGNDAVTIPATDNWTVERLCKTAMVHLGVNQQTQRVRFMHAGRLLNDPHATLKKVLLQRNEGKCVVFCAVSDREPNDARVQIDQGGQGQEEDDEMQPRGLARLRHMGFSPEEIEEVRAQFLAARGGGGQEVFLGVREEEQWMQEVENGVHELSSSSSSSSGSGDDENDERNHEKFFAGLVAGFLLPPLLMFGKEIPKLSRVGMYIGCIGNLALFLGSALFA